MRIYKVYTSGRYKAVIYFVMIVHLFLCFYEPLTPAAMKQDGVLPWVLAVESICLIIEFLDVALKLVQTYSWHLDNILSPKYEDFETWGRLLLVFAIFVDWVLTMSFRFSWEYWIPLRPLLLIGKSSHMRKAASNFVQTLYRAWDVFLFYACLILVASVFGVFLFRKILNNESPDGSTIYDFVPGPSFQHLFSALTTMVVYCLTAENYPDMIYVAYSASAWNVVYYIIVYLISIYFVLALVVGVFQDGFKAARAQVNQKRQLFKRTGLVSAFTLLDLQCTSVISRADFERFVFRLAPHLEENREALDVVFLVLNKFEHDTIDISEFVIGIEMLTLGKRKWQSRIAPWRLNLQAVFDQAWFRMSIRGLLFLHLWCVCVYGSSPHEYILDYVQIIIYGCYFLECTLKLVAFTPAKYWNSAYYLLEHQSHSWLAKARRANKKNVKTVTTPLPRRGLIPADERGSKPRPGAGVTLLSSGPQSAADYHQMEKERRQAQREANQLMFSHRFELVLIMGSGLILFCLLMANFSVEIPMDMFRWLLSLSLLRLFTMFVRLRSLTHGLFKAMPHLWPIVCLITLIFFEYAIVGVALFHGQYTALQSAQIAPEGPSCDSLGLCFLLLFQVFTGQNWQNIMYPGVDALGWSAVLYFVTFFVLAGILFGNLITALFLDSREKDNPHDEDEDKNES